VVYERTPAIRGGYALPSASPSKWLSSPVWVCSEESRRNRRNCGACLINRFDYSVEVNEVFWRDRRGEDGKMADLPWHYSSFCKGNRTSDSPN